MKSYYITQIKSLSDEILTRSIHGPSDPAPAPDVTGPGNEVVSETTH
jgi:hypothetical protein